MNDVLFQAYGTTCAICGREVAARPISAQYLTCNMDDPKGPNAHPGEVLREFFAQHGISFKRGDAR